MTRLDPALNGPAIAHTGLKVEHLQKEFTLYVMNNKNDRQGQWNPLFMRSLQLL
jgi:hypothetical protein